MNEREPNEMPWPRCACGGIAAKNASDDLTRTCIRCGKIVHNLTSDERLKRIVQGKDSFFTDVEKLLAGELLTARAELTRVLDDLDRVSKERLASADALDNAQREIARLKGALEVMRRDLAQL